MIRRRVNAQYNQVWLEPETLNDAERAFAGFQRRGEYERGMSLSPTRVGIGTPIETAHVDIEVALEGDVPSALDNVVQAVAFPFEVRAPLVLIGVVETESEPFTVPHGRYDVLARFVYRETVASLRVYAMRLSFHPPGSQGAPRTLVIAE